MRNKLLFFSVLAILLVTALALQMRSEDSDELTSRDLLSTEQMQQLAALERITLVKGDAQVELIRIDGNWGVLSHAGFPVQRERLAALLHALRGARVIEEKTSNPEHHARLGLNTGANSDALQVRLHATGADFGVVYGNPVGNGQLVRFVDNDQVLLINRPFGMSVNPTDWLALRVVDLPMPLVSSARWTHADGEVLELAKQAEGDYNLKLVGLNEQEQGGNERWINSMVLALANLTVQNVALREELALPEAMLKMQISTWAGSQLEASLYELDGGYWLLMDSFNRAEEDAELQVNADPRWAFQIGIGQLDNLNKRRTDIIRTR